MTSKPWARSSFAAAAKGRASSSRHSAKNPGTMPMRNALRLLRHRREGPPVGRRLRSHPREHLLARVVGPAAEPRAQRRPERSPEVAHAGLVGGGGDEGAKPMPLRLERGPGGAAGPAASSRTAASGSRLPRHHRQSPCRANSTRGGASPFFAGTAWMSPRLREHAGGFDLPLLHQEGAHRLGACRGDLLEPRLPLEGEERRRRGAGRRAPAGPAAACRRRGAAMAFSRSAASRAIAHAFSSASRST